MFCFGEPNMAQWEFMIITMSVRVRINYAPHLIDIEHNYVCVLCVCSVTLIALHLHFGMSGILYLA